MGGSSRICVKEAATLCQVNVSYVHKIIQRNPSKLGARRVGQRLWTLSRKRVLELAEEVARNKQKRSHGSLHDNASEAE
mgnify:CR=1 FL=1